MEKFTKLTGTAAPLPMINVDTDQIIPKQFLRTIKRTGLSEGLFYDLRFDEAGQPKPGFVLDQPAYKDTKILVAGENFGCGSSREHAPWAILDAGIRCVIAPSFGDIFYNNCFKNGILPIQLPKEQVDLLMDDAERGANAVVSIDLEKQEITGPDGGTIHFEIDAFRKHCLLNGLDEIGQTLNKAPPDRRLRGQAESPTALAGRLSRRPRGTPKRNATTRETEQPCPPTRNFWSCRVTASDRRSCPRCAGWSIGSTVARRSASTSTRIWSAAPPSTPTARRSPTPPWTRR